MLILDDLLFGLPVKGVRWVIDQIRQVAEREATNEEPIMQAMLENELAYEEGRIAKAEYEDAQQALMTRLREIRERKKSMAEQQAGERAPEKEPLTGKASLEVNLDFDGYGRGS